MNPFKRIENRNQLADYLNIPRSYLSYILFIKRTENMYTEFSIAKKSGGTRNIKAPSEELKKLQRILAYALMKYKMSETRKSNKISHGFEKGKGIISNSERHRNKKIVLNIDLQDFFETFHFGRVRGFFLKNKSFLFPIEVANTIAQLSCYKGVLPQGSPLSPIITNLICEILDYRIMNIAKRYKLHYTRYADDMTFSTNETKFMSQYDEFFKSISEEILKNGFNINEDKTRLQLHNSRQTVTGLVVNKKLNVNRDYYKETRAMANHLYKYGSFKIDGEEGTINQLEGRFTFINQLIRYNNIKDGLRKDSFTLDAREREYKKFLFYKYFFSNEKPLIVTEGKTDILYLKSALKKHHTRYPNLISKNDDGSFEFKVAFLNKTKRLRYFLEIEKDGASAFSNILNYFIGNNGRTSYIDYFESIRGSKPNNAVIILFDNEKHKEKPLKQFCNKFKGKNLDINQFRKVGTYCISKNLFMQIIPLQAGQDESEIEDLFDSHALMQKINDKQFSRSKSYDVTKYYGKDRFSKYISKNYKKINFEGFFQLLDDLNEIVVFYNRHKENIGRYEAPVALNHFEI